MSNIEIEHHAPNGIIVKDPVYGDPQDLDFAAADTYAKGTILGRLTANSRLTPFVSGGSGGAETPIAVLPEEVSATAAGQVKIRPLIGGIVKRGDLVIDAGTTITQAHIDQLRDYGIVAQTVVQLGNQDNS